MNSIFDIIYIPFGFLIRSFYNISGNYALTLLCFAIIVKFAMMPLTIKQQKNMVNQARLRPKEQAIRKKYAGRSDTATQQKMQNELMEMYKVENFSPMAGCVPMLIQLPVIMALYSIVREPLRYIAQFSADTVSEIKRVAFTLFGELPQYAETIFKNVRTDTAETIANSLKNISEIDIVKIMNDSGNLAAIMRDVPEIPADFANINITFYGDVTLADTPASLGLSLLLLIPLFNLIVTFVQTKVTKKLNAGTQTAELANNKGMKVMEYTMPLMMVYMAYTFPAALGLYWVFQGVIQLVQSIVIAKIYPIPKASDEEYKRAEKEYGVKDKPQKKPRRPYQDDDEDDETSEDLSDTREGDALIEAPKDDKDDGEKYISDNIPKGINQNVKSNYQKTGKKYNVNKKKK